MIKLDDVMKSIPLPAAEGEAEPTEEQTPVILIPERADSTQHKQPKHVTEPPTVDEEKGEHDFDPDFLGYIQAAVFTTAALNPIDGAVEELITARLDDLEGANRTLSDKIEMLQNENNRLSEALDIINTENNEINLKLQAIDKHSKEGLLELHNANEINANNIDAFDVLTYSLAADIIEIKDNQQIDNKRVELTTQKIDEVEHMAVQFKEWSGAVQCALDQVYDYHIQKMRFVHTLLKNNYDFHMAPKVNSLMDPDDPTFGAALIPVQPMPPGEKTTWKDTLLDMLCALVPPLDEPERIEKIK